MNSKVTIIVPAFNEAKNLEECLRSIRNQSCNLIELIVVDDGSTDLTLEISKKYADILLTQKHQGAAIARNNAVKRSKNSILVFIDGDMFLDKNYIKYIIAPIIKGKSEATFTTEEYVANTQNIWSRCFNIDNNLPIDRRISANLSKSTKFRAITRKLFEETGGYNMESGYGEDDILTKIKAVKAKGAVCFHYNPDTLREVFLSARWMGRSKSNRLNLTNIIRYSFINSIVISFKKISKKAPLRFLVYKLVFDFGFVCGLIYKPKYYEK